MILVVNEKLIYIVFAGEGREGASYACNYV